MKKRDKTKSIHTLDRFRTKSNSHKLFYQGIEICKRQAEWILWFEKGSNNWWEAFYESESRTSKNKGLLSPKTWFNKTLKGLKGKGLFINVPFAFESFNGLYWAHPLFENDGYRVEVGIESNPELSTFKKRVI